jgi:hypothetical protein
MAAPPGWSSRKFVTSYTSPLIITQQDSRELDHINNFRTEGKGAVYLCLATSLPSMTIESTIDVSERSVESEEVRLI